MGNVISFSSVLATVADPLFLAGVMVVIGFFGARHWRERSSLAYFLIQLVVFAILTGLILVGGVVPYRPELTVDAEPRRLFVGALEIIWWLSGAWLAIGFSRAFLVLRRQPRESKLVQDLLAALIYVAAAFAIVAYVFDLPVTGLLATSGAVAIIIGLALQSSLGDVFSGIVLNIERPYRVGDWIILDDAVQGKVIETNWRATHILMGNHDVAIIPNSVIAKSRLVNCSTPTKMHGASIRLKLESSLTPTAGHNLLTEILLSSTYILQTPAPTVTIKDLSAEMIDFELSYSVADIGGVDRAQNELFDRIYRAVAVTGAKFAPRLAGWPNESAREDKEELGVPERLLAGVSLFSTLTVAEKAALASQMQRKDYKPGDLIAGTGTILQSLCIVSYGVLIGSMEENGRKIGVSRLAPGDYFGEIGLLTGEPLMGEVTALTRVVIYEISKDALSPLLQARPSIAEELSESLARRRLARRTLLDDRRSHERQHDEGLAERVAANIRRLFSLH